MSERLAEAQGKMLKTIVVEGSGVVTANPDKMEMMIGVSTRASTPTEALAKSTESIDRIIEAFKGLGVEPDVGFWQFAIAPRVTPMQTREDWAVDHTIRVTTTNINLVKVLIEKAVEAGANRMGAVAFTFTGDRLEELRKLAREKAVIDAKAKAETIASSLGVRITGVAGATEGAYPYIFPYSYPPTFRESPAGPAPMMAAMTPRETGVRATVRVTFLIE